MAMSLLKYRLLTAAAAKQRNDTAAKGDSALSFIAAPGVKPSSADFSSGSVLSAASTTS